MRLAFAMPECRKEWIVVLLSRWWALPFCSVIDAPKRGRFTDHIRLRCYDTPVFGCATEHKKHAWSYVFVAGPDA